jgi:hypothetical protein
MQKIWFGVALAALIAGPAPAQDYNKNLIGCLKEAGLHPDPGYAQKLQSDPAQAAFINDCVTRKANLARNPSTSWKPRASQ